MLARVLESSRDALVHRTWGVLLRGLDLTPWSRDGRALRGQASHRLPELFDADWLFKVVASPSTKRLDCHGLGAKPGNNHDGNPRPCSPNRIQDPYAGSVWNNIVQKDEIYAVSPVLLEHVESLI